MFGELQLLSSLSEGKKGKQWGFNSLTLRSWSSCSIWMVVCGFRKALGGFLSFLGFNQFSSRLGWVGLLYRWFVLALPFFLLLGFRPFCILHVYLAMPFASAL